MLPSPPLTAGSCCSSPRSLKRTFTDATDDDAYTPPPSQSLKRSRYSTAIDGRRTEHLKLSSGAFFDPASLVTPPEFTHVPYDPDFGVKVCQQYAKSLRTKRTCDAVVLAARRQKYGEEDALFYSPGSTPDHIRQRYEQKQQELDELAADIIANSDSESEQEIAKPDSLDCASLRRKIVKKRKPGSRMRDSEIISGCNANLIQSRDMGSASMRPPSKSLRNINTTTSSLLRSNDYNDDTKQFSIGPKDGKYVSIRCQAGKALDSFRLRQQSRCQNHIHVAVS